MKKMKLAYLLPALALLVSCSKDDPNELNEIDGTETGVEIVETESMAEVANADVPGNVREMFFGGHKIPVEEFNGEYVYQGDILLPKDMVSEQEVQVVYERGEAPENKSVGRTSARWPDNTVYYAIDSNLDNKTRVYDAIKHWEAKTNIQFVERTSQSNYVYFVSGSGCSSYIGMIGGKQNITLSSSCSTGNTIHEIGHAIGLWHEQARVDRDNYITINYNNIQSGREHNFYTYAQQGFDGAEFTNALDFGSIMMYGSYSFSSNGQPTIVKKDGSTFNIQRSGLSTGDVTGINNMYPYSSGGGETQTEIYVNGETYYISGLTVLRYLDTWYFSTKYGYKRVELINDRWYWV
ncbi:M12 family metallopeptidase [Salinimicrobium gaetbulicola]|uniref:M12 family metallopeptidase n=1 Tax=Salinimicrobium gaetbulicola TaxID=999702 RepID=A0ABW3ICG2_9FLAO